MNVKFSLLFFLILGILTSCEVNEGVGGNATIQGHLVLEQYNEDYSILVSSQPAADEKIYIIYGDDEAVSDDVETSYDGYFEFNYLYEGDYTIFYYSQDTLNKFSPKQEIILTVQLDKGETKKLGEMKTLETLAFDEGLASIKGSVLENFYTYTSVWPNMIIEETLVATELPVYLRYGDNEEYCERIRTQADGSFYFPNLIPGDYTVFVFSEDVLGTDLQVAIEKKITVTTNDNTVYDVETLYIHNL